jgi:hypothetical protein
MSALPTSSGPEHDCPNGRPDLAWANCCGHLYIEHQDVPDEAVWPYTRRLHVSSAIDEGVHISVALEDENGRAGGAGLNLTTEEARTVRDHIIEILDRQGAQNAAA